MIEEKYIELINCEIDHTNSHRNSNKLRKYLENNPEAKRFYSELLVMSKNLSQMSVVEPPSNLKKNIINAIPVGRYSIHEKQNAIKRYFANFFLPIKLRYTYVFSSGLIAGIVVVSIMFVVFNKYNIVNVSDSYGTIGAKSTDSNFKSADKLTISENGIMGDVRSSYSDNEIFIDATICTTTDVKVMMQFDENDMNFKEFKKSIHFGNDIVIRDNMLQFVNVGENHYFIALNRITPHLSPVQLKIYSSDSLLYNHALLNDLNKDNKY